MTLPDPRAPRKPPAGKPLIPKRPSRFWLFAPYVVLLIAIIGWSAAWVWIRGQVASRMDAAARDWRDAGYTMDWSARRIDGYPFRIDVTLDGVKLAEPSGWAVAAPQIKAEADAYRPDQWIGYAPNGIVLTRPVSGPVTIASPALRASYVPLDGGAARIALEAVTPVFTPAAGAKPFLISAARYLDFHLRPAGPDAADFLLRVDGAAAPARAMLGLIAGGRPMDIAWEGRLSNLSALRGRDWPSAARAWSAAGGGLDVEHGTLNAGAIVVNLRPGRLTIDLDGRLRGTVGLDLRQAPDLIQALAAAQAIDPAAVSDALTVAKARAGAGAVTSADLTFLAGAMAFGPVAIGAAPRVY